MRSAFALLSAMVVVILVALIAALMIQTSTTSAKQISDEYLRAEAELLAISGTEFALLAISANDRNSSCLEHITIHYPNDTNATHEVNIDIQYIGNSLTCPGSINRSSIVPESDVTVIIDVVSEVVLDVTEPIRIHRRTIQKP